jgi:hypothetical protein
MPAIPRLKIWFAKASIIEKPKLTHRWLKKIGRRVSNKPVKLPIELACEMIVAKSCSFTDYGPGLSV